MTDAKAEIVALFETPPTAERLNFYLQLTQMVHDFNEDDLTPEEIEGIEKGIAQAEREEVLDGDEMFSRIAKQFGFTRAR
jgi:hypothetical protein